MNKKHSVESDIERHSVDSDIESDIESDKMFDCDVCGALYRDQETLSDHIIKCGEDDHEDEGDETVWEELVQEVYDKHDETYQSKVQTYEEEGMTQSDVESRANDDMRTIYKKGLISMYKKLLTYMNGLEDSAYHQTFMNDIERFENRGYLHKKAIKAALKKNKHVFDQILNQFEPDSDEDSSDEDEDDSSDEDANDKGNDDDDTEDEEPPVKRTKL